MFVCNEAVSRGQALWFSQVRVFHHAVVTVVGAVVIVVSIAGAVVVSVVISP